MAYVEIEAFIIANLVAGMEAGILDPAPIWTDAKTFDAQPFRGRIHGIIGGYPCPGESLAGLREGHLYKGFLWPYLRRAVAATRPFFCFFENVDDHLTGTYPIVQRSLCNMGYRVEAGVYSAEEVGAPHERQRLFILAISDSYLRCGNPGTKRMGWETGSNISGSSAESELANSYSHGYGAGAGQVIAKSGKAESKTQRQEWNDLLREWMRDVVRDSGKELDDTSKFETKRANTTGRYKCNGENPGREETAGGFELAGEESLADEVGQRLEGLGIRAGGTEQEFTLPTCGSSDKWPARPGEQQRDWEEPRTIESGMGSTIDGYNFREDLLRALGNSVVEQTAELAFIDLMNKHLKNL
jgi:DNA (cytosine-5)-methyltransferase 1